VCHMAGFHNHLHGSVIVGIPSSVLFALLRNLVQRLTAFYFPVSRLELRSFPFVFVSFAGGT
jgi:hypothetical protein